MSSAVADTAVNSTTDQVVQRQQSAADDIMSAVEALEVLTSAHKCLEGLPTDADTVNSVVDSLIAEALSHALAVPTASPHPADKDSTDTSHLLVDVAAVSENSSLNAAAAGRLPHLADKDSSGNAHLLDDEAAVSENLLLDTVAAEDLVKNNKAAAVLMGSESNGVEDVSDAAAPAAVTKSTEEVGAAMSETLQQGAQAGRVEGSQRFVVQNVNASQEAGCDTSVPREGASDSKGMLVA